jgi:hypothetical protein
VPGVSKMSMQNPQNPLFVGFCIGLAALDFGVWDIVNWLFKIS